MDYSPKNQDICVVAGCKRAPVGAVRTADEDHFAYLPACKDHYERVQSGDYTPR